MIWKWMYHPDFGVVNEVLRWFGLAETPKWLSSPVWAKPSLIIMEIWRLAGYDMLLYLAAL